jgi:hypothetical protein
VRNGDARDRACWQAADRGCPGADHRCRTAGAGRMMAVGPASCARTPSMRIPKTAGQQKPARSRAHQRGSLGLLSRTNWREHPQRETLTGCNGGETQKRALASFAPPVIGSSEAHAAGRGTAARCMCHAERGRKSGTEYLRTGKHFCDPVRRDHSPVSLCPPQNPSLASYVRCPRS